MEFEDIAKLVNRVALEQKGRPLKDVERIVLKGAWENQTYSAMADLGVGYTEDYLKKDVGPKLWRLLSDLVDPDQHSIKVTKRNIQNVLHTWAMEDRPAFQEPGSEVLTPGAEAQAAAPAGIEAPAQVVVVREFSPVDVSDFYGREEELTTLTQWIEADQCRLILLWGAQGVGKTALAAKLAERLYPTVDLCGYLALPPAITDQTFLAALVNWLTPQATQPPATPTLDWVLGQLEQRRCLLLIDQTEHLFESQQLAGHYRVGTEAVQQLFQQVAERRHRSCLVWISREKPADLSQFLTGRVRENHLDDLTLADAQIFLQQQGPFQAGAEDWLALVERYGSSPLLLRGLAATIQAVYQGQIKPFLALNQLTIPLTVHRSLEQALDRLSTEEQDLLYWLTLAQEPVSLGDLNNAMHPYPGDAVVQSLLGRSLCYVVSKVGGDATILNLKPVVRTLVNEYLLPLLVAELEEERFDLLHRLPLVNMTAREVVQERQRATLLRPLVADLQQRYPLEAALIDKCQQLHRVLRQTCLGATGYGAGNFIHICQNLGISVSGVDFSAMAIWQADLRQVSLQGANFSQAQFSDTVFATALGRSPVATFSPDGRYLATGDHEGRLLLWELGRGKLVQVLDDGGSQAIHALAFSPTGDGLAVGTASGQIWLWPLGGTYRADSFLKHEAPVRALAFSPQGDLLVSGDDSGAICLWDLASGMCEGGLTDHQGAIHSLAFDQAGDRLVSGGDDQQAYLWDIRQKTRLHSFQTPSTAWVRTAGFLANPEDPDCPPLAYAAGYDEQCLTIWDLKTGRPCWILPADVEALPAMAISPNGRYLVCSRQDFIVAMWDIPTRTACYTLPSLNSPVWMLNFSPDSRYFVTGSDYTVQLWGTTTGHCVRSFLSQAHPVRCLAFTAHSDKILTGHDDAQLRLWQLNTASPFANGSPTLADHAGAICSVAVSPDGEWFASSAEDQTIRLWQSATGQCQRVLSTPPATLLSFSPDGHWLASASEDPAVLLWDLATGVCVGSLDGHDGSPSALAFSGDSRWLVSGSRDCTIRVWDLHRKACHQTLVGHQSQVHGLSISLDGRQVASASHDDTIRWWDLTSGQELGHWRHPGGQWLRGVTIDSAGEILAITSNSPQVEVWAVQANQCRHQLVGHSRDIWQVFISPDRQYLATASQDDEIRLWPLDLGSCQQVLRPDRPYEGVNIRGATGLSGPESTMLRSLGAMVSY